MATKRDYYEILGVSKSASDGEIATAYRRIAIKHHPDRTGDDPEAIEIFKEASEAYEVLRDGDKRARYDQFGHAGVGAGGPQFQNVDDIFEAFGDMFGGGGGIFGDLFGASRRGRSNKGASLRVETSLTLEEAAAGVEKELRFRRNEACDTCHGSGAKPGTQPRICPRCQGRGAVVQQAGILRVETACPQCRGERYVVDDPCPECKGRRVKSEEVRLTVAIPPGIDDGMQVRLAGEGEPSLAGGPRGDCLVAVHVRPHKMFQRDGRHLVLQMPISYTQAALGATIEAPTLNGPATLKIPPGTPAVEVFRIPGRGMPDPHGGPPGDLAVRTYVEVPKKVSGRQEEILRELAEVEAKNVSPHRKSFLDNLKELFTGAADDAE
ncbi:MAG TPA: molecular chaperone DnaJ [Pirellulaceae bacterium]|nr:molecular chaperone DnaJ [Pirellulaceae bacterium]